MIVIFEESPDKYWHWRHLGFVPNKEEPEFVMGYKKGGSDSILEDLVENQEHPIVDQQKGIDLANSLYNTREEKRKDIILFI